MSMVKEPPILKVALPWHASDASYIQGAINDGFQAAMEKAAKEGYDVYDMNLDPSAVSIEAAGE